MFSFDSGKLSMLFCNGEKLLMTFVSSLIMVTPGPPRDVMKQSNPATFISATASLTISADKSEEKYQKKGCPYAYASTLSAN